MENSGPSCIPLMRVAPMFYKEKTFWETRLTPEEKFRDIGSVDFIESNPHNLDELLVTSLARISSYDSNTLELKRTYKTNTQFQVYGGCFRKIDGRLIAAGSEEGKVFVFESHSISPLRIFDLKVPTRRVVFKENHLVTFSDDKAIRLMDVGSGSTLRKYGPDDKCNRSSHYHKDYIRSGCLIGELIVSGSYDNTVKFWDPRTDELKPVMEFDQGAAVESMCTRGATLLVSVGGNKLHVYDMVAGKTLTNIIPKHHKTITCVANYDDKYLLTGALDGYLNILDFNYEYITRYNYDEAQILSLVVNPKMLAVGFNDHCIHLRRFKDFIKKSNNEMAELEKLKSVCFAPNMVTRYFHEAIFESQDPAASRRSLLAIQQKKKPVVLNDVDSLYKAVELPRLKKRHPMVRNIFDNYLRKFLHAKALSEAIKTFTSDPDSFASILQELIKRDKLKTAMAGCHNLESLMFFLGSNMNGTRHYRLFLDSSLILIELLLHRKDLVQYGTLKDTYWHSIDKLSEGADSELEVIDKCTLVGAQLETIMSQY